MGPRIPAAPRRRELADGELSGGRWRSRHSGARLRLEWTPRGLGCTGRRSPPHAQALYRRRDGRRWGARGGGGVVGRSNIDRGTSSGQPAADRARRPRRTACVRPVIVADQKKLTEYYSDPWVRRRIREYCGETATGPTCVYLAPLSGDHETGNRSPRIPVNALEALLADGADVARSMWDRSNMLIHLDLDYQNVDHADEPYRHPAEMFARLEPIYRATVSVLHRFGLPLLPLITGRGYHFTGRVPLDSDVTMRLASIAPETPSWFSTLADRCPAWMAEEMSPVQARAYMGVGLVVEFLAHRILKRAHRRAEIPVVLNGTVVGSGRSGRECVSIDLSYAGDPLDARHLRVAYSSYQKHTAMARAAAAGRVAPLAAVPRHRESLPALISGLRRLRHAIRTARQRPAGLPLVSAGMHRVLDAYEMSHLAAFH